MRKIINILYSRLFVFTLLILLSILFIHNINELFKYPEIYNGKIFLFDSSVLGYFKTFFIFAAIILVLHYIQNNSRNINFFDTLETYQICIIIFISSFLFKWLLHGFDFYTPISRTDILEIVFDNETFNYYKLYSYIVLFLSKITNDYEIYLGLFNLILGSLIPMITYLICLRLQQNILMSLFISSLVIFFMPLNALESVYRIDLLYVTLFILSIYLTLISKDYRSYSFISLILVLILSCFSREQTIYILPLYILYFFTLSKRKNIAMPFILLLIITPLSLFISKYNEINYGSSSYFRDGHLVIKILQYGYLSEYHSSKIINELNEDELILYNKIKKSYHSNVLPHKRENFDNVNLPKIWYLIRPDKENVYQKNHRSVNGGNLKIVTNEFSKQIDLLINSSQVVDTADIQMIVKEMDSSLSREDKMMAYDIESIIVNDVFNDKTTLGNLKNDEKFCSEGKKIDKACLIFIINQINQDYLNERSDLWFLKKAGLYDFALIFNPVTKMYDQPDNIHLLKNIILTKPELYITQSILTLTSMSGYFPVPANLGGFSSTIDRSIVPQAVTIKMQKIYYLMINLWYILCFISLFYFLIFIKYKKENSDLLFIAIVPLYYGLFLSFSTFNEFSRLMLPIVPFIFMAFILFLSQIISSYLIAEK